LNRFRMNTRATGSVLHADNAAVALSMSSAALVVISGAVLCKLAGFAREVVIAAYFGTRAQYDVFLIALTIPTVIYAVTRYTLPNVFIPIFSKFKIDSSEKKAWSFFWAFLNVNVVTFILLSVLIFAFSLELLKVIAPGLNQHQLAVAAGLLRTAVVIVIFGGIETVLRGLLNSYKQFAYPAFAPLFYNLAIILSVINLSGGMGTRALLWGMVSGILLQMLVMSFAFLRHRTRSPFRLKIYEEGMRETARVIFFILAIESCGQLYVLVDRFLASSLPEGSISALSYANLLFQLPLSVFALALSTAIFPYLTEEAVRRNWPGLSDRFSKSLRMIIFLTVPITFFLLVFPKQIVAVIYQRGAFDSQSTLMTSRALVFYALGLLFFSGYALLLKMFYSLSLVKILVLANLLSISIKLTASLTLVNFLSFEALALTTSLSGIFLFCFLLVILKNRMTSFRINDIIRVGLKTVFISLISFGAGKGLSVFLNLEGVSWTGSGTLLWKLALISTVIVIIFSALSFWMKMEEPRRLKDICISCCNKLT